MKLSLLLPSFLELIRKFLLKKENLFETRLILEQQQQQQQQQQQFINNKSRSPYRWPPISPQRENDTKFDIVLRSKAQPNGCVCKDLDLVLNEPCTKPLLDAGCLTQTSESYAWGVTRFQHFTFVVSHHYHL